MAPPGVGAGTAAGAPAGDGATGGPSGNPPVNESFGVSRARVEAFWLWQPSRARLTWYDAPWVNFLGWTVSTLLILAFVTPLLINKRPGKSAPPDYPPLAVWLLIQLLFLTGALVKKLWPAVAVASLTSLLVITLVLLALRKTADT